MKKRSKRLLAVLAGLAVIAGAGCAFRREIFLAYLAWDFERSHPVEPNRPIEWADGPISTAMPLVERPPNVVVILADDLGFNDVSFHGGGVVPTPAIDSIGRDGASFSNAYSAAPICAPSRAALLTGRYATRSGFEFCPVPRSMGKVLAILGGHDGRPHQPKIDEAAAGALPPMQEQGLPGTEVTLAEVLRARGYHTVHIGKWHLGSSPPYRPAAQGFDESLMLEGTRYSPPDSPEALDAKKPGDPVDVTMWRIGQHAVSFGDGAPFAPRGYLTDYFTDEAVKVIEKNRNRPFFLYLAHWAVHVPMQASREDYDALPDIADHDLRVHAAMVRSLDRSVRRVLDALRANGLEDDTIVIFSSDNGGPDYVGLPDLNKPYRGWKLTMFEGGTHVVEFLKWPKRVEKGTRLDAPVSHLDLLPTIAAAAGAEVPEDRPIDGVDLLPYLAGEKTGRPHDRLFWREGGYRAVWADGWKLHVSENPKKAWLFDLSKDPYEGTNLADQDPARVEELRGLLDAFDREQAPPMWPWFSEMPIWIDKTIDDPVTEDDEYVYWPN